MPYFPTGEFIFLIIIITNPRIATQCSPFNRCVVISQDVSLRPETVSRAERMSCQAVKEKHHPHLPKTNRIYYIFTNSFDELTFNFDLITKLHFIAYCIQNDGMMCS